MNRIAGKRGRLQPLADKLPLRFVHEYAKRPLPEPTYPVDVTGGIGDWKMLGNGPDPTCTVRPDGVGDCTFAGRQHYRMCKAAHGQEAEAWETSDQLVTEYLQYDNGQDVGANIATLLQYWQQTGKIMAFAPVDHTDPEAMDAAMQAFNGLYCGVNLTIDADQLFESGQPWTVADGQSPDPGEGHCIVKVYADNLHDGWITWGAEQKSTKDWSAACVDEAWVIITKEDTATHVIDLGALQADIEALNDAAAA